jgi:hypothetical protein
VGGVSAGGGTGIGLNGQVAECNPNARIDPAGVIRAGSSSNYACRFLAGQITVNESVAFAEAATDSLAAA